MILITGGSYQGKLEYARSRFGLAEDDICLNGVDLDKKCLAYIDRWALQYLRDGGEPAILFRANADALKDKIVITTDISSGVVPMDPELRAWREACGRMNSYLASQADEVWRLFCGIPQRLK
ncbi:MAG: bifunctional adenosylcobinamide kinase/adenosylcobinamide-phosphate guanylyltransferase [Clostridia bacterium]|nr:bifunctional adenosylcobinamide kinase/adenosylcobinamide-phosphate guanylyltransferase [Clostridia bacterium]